MGFFFFFFFFFKQKTAYEIRPCDWSSDVCSSDLWVLPAQPGASPRSPRSWWGEAPVGGPVAPAAGRRARAPARGHVALSGARMGARHRGPGAPASDRVRVVAQPNSAAPLSPARRGGGAARQPPRGRGISRGAIRALGVPRGAGVEPAGARRRSRPAGTGASSARRGG